LRRFADLSIRPSNMKVLTEMMKFAQEKLEIGLLGIEAGGLCDAAREVGKRFGVEVLCRAVLRGETRRDIARQLSKLRGRDLVKVVEIRTLDVARYAAVKDEIDVLRFEPEAFRYIDKSQSRLIRDGGNKPVEISLAGILKDPSKLPKVLVALRRSFSLGIDVILVSDATRIAELIHPRGMAGIASLAGIPGDLALSYVSTVPFTLLNRPP